MLTVSYLIFEFISGQCEEVCRLALIRRYCLLPHIYTLFYMAHTRGTPVATPTFFADLKDPELRKLENSFMLGPLLVYASSQHDKDVDQVQKKLPKGIWLSFDFEDSHPVGISRHLNWLSNDPFICISSYLDFVLSLNLEMLGFAGVIPSRWINYSNRSPVSTCW
nr:alpha-glucosidase 2 [Ipomoea batatas]